MRAGRLFHHAVVVSGLPNVNDYIDRRNRTRMMAPIDYDESISCSVI
jgi:hypothetical protein